MADVITRFKLETTQFDSALRDASKSLSSVAREAQKAGKDFVGFSKENVDAARALGQTASGAVNAKGKLTDLVGAFNDAAKAYNNLTQEQQKSDFGKALSQSLEHLQQRIKETKSEVYSLNDSLKNTGGSGLFSNGKLDGALQVLGGNLMTKAAGVAMSFANSLKDAAVEGIEMAKAGEGIRNAFERLNRPDLLDKLKEATHGTVTELELMKQAVKFNDFKLNLDDMGTLLAFAQQKAKDTGQSVDYMVDSIVTGLGRQSLMILDNLGLSASQVKEKMKETGDMTKAVAEIIREQMSDAGEYVETAADRAAKADADLKNAMEELGRTLSPLADQGSSLWNTLEIGAIKTLNNGIKPLVPALLELKNTIGDIFSEISNSPLWDAYISSMEKAGEVVMNSVNPALSTLLGLLKAVPEEKPILGAAISQLANAANGGGGSGSVSLDPQKNKNKTKTTKIDKVFAPDSIAAMEKYISDLTKKWKEAGDSVRDLYSVQIDAAKDKLAEMTGSASPNGSIAELTARMNELKKEQSLATSTEGWKKMQREINVLAIQIKELKGEMGGVSITEGISASVSARESALKNGKIDFSKSNIPGLDDRMKQLQEMAEYANVAAGAIGNIAQAFNSLEDPAAKVAGTVMQSIATVAIGYATATLQAAKYGPWVWAAFAATGLGQMITMISQIHSATGYAGGGTVEGTHFSGDMEWARLNAGETVLTQAQTGIVASALQQNGGGNFQLETRVSADVLRIILRRGNAKRGYGTRNLVL